MIIFSFPSGIRKINDEIGFRVLEIVPQQVFNLKT